MNENIMDAYSTVYILGCFSICRNGLRYCTCLITWAHQKWACSNGSDILDVVINPVDQRNAVFASFYFDWNKTELFLQLWIFKNKKNYNT